MYWLTGKFNAFLLKIIELLVLFPHVEFADHVMLPMALAIVVAFAVLPLNLAAFMGLEDARFNGSWIVPFDDISSTLAKALIPIVRGATVAFPGRRKRPLIFTG